MPRSIEMAAASVTAGIVMLGSAAAHTPYLLPNAFAVSKDHVTIQAALTEDIYFSPDIPIRATSYRVTEPAGTATSVDRVSVGKDLAVVEVPLPVDGTYRISTGDYVSRTMRMAKIDGRWRTVRPGRGPGAPSPAPQARNPGEAGAPRANARPEGPARFVEEGALSPGAEVAESRFVMTSETFVTKGAPTAAALATTGKGLELKPFTHPNEIYLDGGFAFAMLLDGKPLPNLHLAVYRGGNTYEDRKIAADLRSDADGRATLALDRPGTYLMTASYPGRRAEGEPPPETSYLYSLTFEILQ